MPAPQTRTVSTATHVANSTLDLASGLIGLTSAALAGSRFTKAFVESAAMSDMYECEAAEIVLERSKDRRFIQLAKQIIEDHTASTRKLKHALSRSDAKAYSHLPEHLDGRRQGMIDHLREAPDEKFEDMFLDQQLMAHHEAVMLFRGHAANGPDPAIRTYAEKMLPILQRHADKVAEVRNLRIS